MFKNILDSLEDTHVWELAQRITSEQELLDLGLKVLQLRVNKIKSSLYNKGDIELAAHEALRIWRNIQKTPQEAYWNLRRGLLDHGWKQLANELLPKIPHKATSTQSRNLSQESESISSNVLEQTKPPVPIEVDVVLLPPTDYPPTTASSTETLEQIEPPTTASITDGQPIIAPPTTDSTTVQIAPAADDESVGSSLLESSLPESKLIFLKSSVVL